MRRAFIAALLLAAPASTQAATLRVASSHPLTVRGSHFHPHERVRLVVSHGTQRLATRHIRAGRHGRLRATFDLSSPPCGRVSVTAFGAQGSQAETPGLKYPDCVVD